MSNLYIPRIGPHISCNWIDRSIVGIYKSLTDTWMWKLGLWPCNSFSGNICSNFRVFCLCSVTTYDSNQLRSEQILYPISLLCWGSLETTSESLVHALYSQKLIISESWYSCYAYLRILKFVERYCPMGTKGGSKLISMDPLWCPHLPASVLYLAPRDTITRGA